LNDGGTVESSYATGNVSVSSKSAGGLVGYNRGTVNTSYATGEPFAGDALVGGLVGNSGGTVTDSYWDTEKSGQDTSAGSATGLTTTEMKGGTAESNMNFNFPSTWEIRTGSQISYPFLQDNTQTPAPGLEQKPGERDCVERRSVGRGQEVQECPDDRGMSRGESRWGIDRGTDDRSGMSRRDRGRSSRGR
jgi:hypothetical protein